MQRYWARIQIDECEQINGYYIYIIIQLQTQLLMLTKKMMKNSKTKVKRMTEKYKITNESLQKNWKSNIRPIFLAAITCFRKCFPNAHYRNNRLLMIFY